MNTNLTFGTDPEYFIVENINEKEYGVPVPHFIENLGVPEIGYDETRKHPVIIKEDNYRIMMDGIAAEFTVPPVKTAIEMFNNVNAGLDHLRNFSKSFGYDISVKPTVYYDFYKWYREDNKALEWCGVFGCDPDRDAILEFYNSPTIDVTTHPYRYGGGHLHISDNNQIIKDLPIPFIRLLACTVGNYSIASSPYPELEKARMFKYGQPGRYRVQNYPDGNIGVEYRSPSNIWTTNLESIEGVFYWANRAYELLQDRDRAINILETFLDLTIETIQAVNQEQAKYILEQIERM